MEAKWFNIANCPTWAYATKIHHGTCVVDQERITMRFTVAFTNPTRVPDVLDIEQFCRTMANEPATLEGYTAKLAAFLACSMTGKGKTRTHGVITCTICG